MTRLNISLDNPSPLLSYTPPSLWHSATAASDPNVTLYANGSTASVSFITGAQMNFSFRGTGIWIYGSKRDNHGFYNVTFDGEETETFDGYQSPDAYQQLLFGAPNLELGTHNISIINAGPYTGTNASRTLFDIDWVTFENEFEGPGGPIGALLSESTFNSSHPRFEYLPLSNSWTRGDGADGLTNVTSAMTKSGGAIVQLTFDGDAVALYGAVGTAHGNFTASVNGAQSRTRTGYYDTSSYGQMLYYADSLGAGSHVLQVTNNPLDNAKAAFSVEYASTWQALGGSGGVGTAPVGSKSKSNVGVVVGATVGGVVFAVVLAALIILLLRRRRRRRPANPSNKSFAKEQAVHIPYRTESSSTMLGPGHHSKDASFDLVSRRTIDSTSSNVTDSSFKGLLARDLSDGSEPIPMSRIRDAHSTDLVIIPQADNAAVVELSTSDTGYHRAG